MKKVSKGGSLKELMRYYAAFKEINSLFEVSPKKLIYKSQWNENINKKSINGSSQLCFSKHNELNFVYKIRSQALP